MKHFSVTIIPPRNISKDNRIIRIAYRLITAIETIMFTIASLVLIGICLFILWMLIMAIF